MKLTAILFALLLAASSAFAFSGFPTPTYPYSNYGVESRWYAGPWGEYMVHGSYGYFPNQYGYRPYGISTYGYMYTPWDIRYGNTMGRSYGRPY